MHKENEKIKDIKDTKEEVEIAYVAQTFCKKCYGRGYIGREIHTNKYIPCKCLKAIQLPKETYKSLQHKELHI